MTLYRTYLVILIVRKVLFITTAYQKYLAVFLLMTQLF